MGFDRYGFEEWGMRPPLANILCQCSIALDLTILKTVPCVPWFIHGTTEKPLKQCGQHWEALICNKWLDTQKSIYWSNLNFDCQCDLSVWLMFNNSVLCVHCLASSHCVFCYFCLPRNILVRSHGTITVAVHKIASWGKTLYLPEESSCIVT